LKEAQEYYKLLLNILCVAYFMTSSVKSEDALWVR